MNQNQLDNPQRRTWSDPFTPRGGWPAKLDVGGYWVCQFNQYTGEQQTEPSYVYKADLDRQETEMQIMKRNMK